MSSSTALRTVRRRTLRVAAAALVVAAGLTLTACNDSDANASKPAASAGSSSADSSTGAKGSEGTGVKGSDGTGAKGSDAKVDTQAGAADEAASPDRTETLVDGSTAKIYKLGDQHYRLKIVNGSDVLATFEANGRDAGLDANGMYVVLTMGGEVQSWMGGEHRGRAPSSSRAVGRPRSRRSARATTVRRSSATVTSWARWRRTGATPGSTPTACTSCSAPAV
ncbi:hypothetical protein SVIO_041440 [Streptomyces violaceusniger]|uniref:Uncharacterized protein n=1 Tax=Streptomyces violaceusniger TaxID=68280 RepID=A0A4D4KW38_STRVO|nr:hypothetical protein SVIO_041440 [Streptomyces violaceusniger]